MSKQVISGLFAMSVVAMWWTEADAHTCVAWQNIGGTNTCVKWSTKGVLVEGEVDGPQCGDTGKDCTFTVTAKSTTGNIAFCQNKATLVIRKAVCHVPQSFAGSVVGCEPQNDDDDSDNDADNGDDDDNACKVTIVPENSDPSSCQSSCLEGEVVVDVTPAKMATTVTVSNGFKNGFAVVLRRLLLGLFGDFAQADAQDQEQDCGESPSCTIAEHCTIDRKKIKFNRVNPYQCELLPDGKIPK